MLSLTLSATAFLTWSVLVAISSLAAGLSPLVTGVISGVSAPDLGISVTSALEVSSIFLAVSGSVVFVSTGISSLAGASVVPTSFLESIGSSVAFSGISLVFLTSLGMSFSVWTTGIAVGFT